MEELLLRYFWILAVIGAGVFVRRKGFFESDGKGIAAFVTGWLFPAYVFGSIVGLDPVTLSFSSWIRIALGIFAVSWAVYGTYRRFLPDPYPFVAASRNFRSLGIPLLYFRFYDSILQEVAVFAVLGMAAFESVASSIPSRSDGKRVDGVFAKSFFAAFLLWSAVYWMGNEGIVDYSWLNLWALVGKGACGYAYSVLSLFFIGYAVAPALKIEGLRAEFRSAFPVFVSQLAVWPIGIAALLLVDSFSGFVTGGVSEIGSALTALSFMPASITSAAVCARSGRFEPAKWVAASIALFLLYCPVLLADGFVSGTLSVLDSPAGGVLSPR